MVAHRRGDLDGLGDPRLPRAERRVDEEPGSREDGDAAVLHVGSGDPAAVVAEPVAQRDLERAAERRAPRARRARAQGRAALLGHAERRRAASARGPVARDPRRDPRQRARGEVHVVRLARPDGRDTRAGRAPARKIRRVCSAAGSSSRRRSRSARTSCPRTSTEPSERPHTRRSSSRSVRHSASIRRPALPEIAMRNGARLIIVNAEADTIRRSRRRGRT